MYTEVYSKLFDSVPDHPQKTRPRVDGAKQLPVILRYVTPHSAFLEVGGGDGALAIAVSPHVQLSYCLDVTDALIPSTAPENFRFVKTPGVEIALPDASIDFAYSNQLMEHLHPDDAADQLAEIRRVLKPNGMYLCTTPSRVTGPHDVSCYFSYEAEGFHLREYDYGSLRRVFRQAGFRHAKIVLVAKGRRFRAPYWALRPLEMSVLAMPPKLRAKLTSNVIASGIFGLNMIGVK